MDVTGQLETHNFGRESVEAVGLPFVNRDRWEDWLAERYMWKDVSMVYGNPRCTGFSTITSGYGEDTHGPWAKQTQDVHDLCKFAVQACAPVIVWESVQQAYSVGRPLLDHLRDALFVPAGYRIAHLMLNAASWGNCQNRRRYFFVAYRGDLRFNVEPPTLAPFRSDVRDVIERFVCLPTEARKLTARDCDYHPDCYQQLTPDEWSVVPHLPQGMCLNLFARHRTEDLRHINPDLAFRWDTRCSDLPFSLHCISRLAWNENCPTMHGSCGRFIHPQEHRPVTIRELSTIMGWPEGVTPRGWNPTAQLAKGVVPAVGRWLAEQAVACLEGKWGRDDWESTFNARTGTWEGRWLDGEPTEKYCDLTAYVSPAKGDSDARV